ncbi:MAG: hypothetical protein WCT40_02185 [Candidatus Magasanikbacteria bacterium]|jgi:hypothetical protein
MHTPTNAIQHIEVTSIISIHLALSVARQAKKVENDWSAQHSKPRTNISITTGHATIIMVIRQKII